MPGLRLRSNQVWGCLVFYFFSFKMRPSLAYSGNRHSSGLTPEGLWSCFIPLNSSVIGSVQGERNRWQEEGISHWEITGSGGKGGAERLLKISQRRVFLKKWFHVRWSHSKVQMATVSHLALGCKTLELPVGLFLCVDTLVGLDIWMCLYCITL